MTRVLGSQDYFMKSLVFVLLFGFISLGAIGGCSDNGGGQNSTQALTENDFAEDSALRADPEKGVIVTFLESPVSEETENDTGVVGVDEIPFTYRKTVEQTFCWEDDEASAMHFMELRDNEGSLILMVESNGDCVTEVIEAGDYLISIYNDGRIGDALAIFLIPNAEESEQAKKTDGFIEKVNVAAANILKAIQKTVTKDAEAQTVMENRDTLLSTNSCVRCNLERTNLSEANLFRADLRSADFSSADLRRAILSEADLTGAILTRTNLSEANLFRADLRFADISGANLSGAIWCNSCTCADPSIGTCVGCPPAEEVCTGP